jgi:hypothetical protein
MPYGTALAGILGGGSGNNLVTTLYTGNATARSLVTGQNQSGQGALNWIKSRSASRAHKLFDSDRGINKFIESSSTDAEATYLSGLTAFNTNGFSLGTETNINNSGEDFVAWSFLQKAGFMDIVEYAGVGNGIFGASGNQTLSHNLGVTPHMMIVKRTNTSSVWYVYHNALGNRTSLRLNTTFAADTTSVGSNFAVWGDTSPTSTEFTVGPRSDVNTTGGNYIAYLFAHNPAQKIYCGTFTTDSSGNATITGLGFRPKLIDLKTSSIAGDWHRLDEERGFDKQLELNTSDAETTVSYMAVTSDGFTLTGYTASATGIFWAVG